MPEKIVEDLQYIAKKMEKIQKHAMQSSVEDGASKYSLEERLAAVEQISGIFTGMYPEHVNIQWIKANSGN